MTPTRSNLNRETCSPVSSNCVIWQGPDITCLNLCKGDTISDVMYKLATDVCTLIENVGISDVDLTALVNVCIASPEPVKTLTNVLNLIIAKVICIDDALNALPPIPDAYVEPTYIPSQYSCLSTGGLSNTTPLPISQFIELVANQLCTVDGIQQGLVGDVLQNTADIEYIQNNYYPQPNLPTLTNCLTGISNSIEVVTNEIQQSFCDYAETLGDTVQLTDAQNSQCLNLNSQPKLCGDGKQLMSGITGWQPTVTNLAQSLQNLWLTVCDIRCAVKLIQDNCCKVSCADITVDFDYKWVDATTLKLFFTPKTVVPYGFYDCGDTGDTSPGPGQILTFTDGNGNTWDNPSGLIHLRYKSPTNLTGIVTNMDIMQNGFEIDLSTANAIDVTTGLTITSNVCLTDGTNSCIKCLTKTVAAYDDGIAAAPTCCTITATKAVTITYQTCVDITA